MRHVFIINPSAGKKDPSQTAFPAVQNYFKSKNIDYSLYLTKYPKHATEIAKMEAEKGGPIRLWAMGGDGTLNEVAAGVFGKENAEVGIFPCGSGNDYIKTFGSMEDFLIPEKQVAAESRPMDVIRSEYGVSVNLASVGLDARVEIEMEKLKRYPFVSGPLAYQLALVKILLGKIGDELEICIDEEKTYRGRFLFAASGNGRYYGGGFCCAPLAVPDDGLLDFILIRKPAFFKIPKLVSVYKAGKHIGSKDFEKILTFIRGKKIEIRSHNPIAVNLDGECCMARQVKFEIIPKAFRFIIPCPIMAGEFVKNL